MDNTKQIIAEDHRSSDGTGVSGRMCNIHDYLDAIGAEPPPVDERALAEAKANIIMCDSIEEAVEVMQSLDAAEETNNKKEKQT